jgi:hypothetical protein
LVGGADRFGLLTLTADAADFAAVQAGAPAGAVGAVLRLPVGPAGYGDAFPGFDALLLINFSSAALTNAAFGALAAGSDLGFSQSLLQGGFLTDPAFGGAGALPLGSLTAGSVYETLVPLDETLFNAGADGVRAIADAPLGENQAVYLVAVPEPGTFGLLAVGLLALGVRGRRGLLSPNLPSRPQG